MIYSFSLPARENGGAPILHLVDELTGTRGNYILSV